MNLDRHTYEAWLLDRAEGHLSPEQERLLAAFLLANPDLTAPKGTLPRLESAGETFNEKESLLRSFPPAGAPTSATLNDFLAARLEGDLSTEQEKQLDRYLYEHPETAHDAAAMARATVIAGPMVFAGKAGLGKHFPPHGMPDAQRLTDFLIADAEGDLTAEQQIALERHLLQYPAAQREQGLVAAARIQPSPLVFPWKQELRKREVRVLPLWTRWAAAASIALLMGMGWWFFQKNQRGNAGIALKVQPIAPVPLARTLPDTTPEVVPRSLEHAVTDRPETVKSASLHVPEKPVQPKHQPQAAPVKVQPSDRPTQERTAPEPPAQPLQQPMPEAAPKPALAQQPDTESQEEVPMKSIVPAAEPKALATVSEGQSLGLFVVNKVRGKVLDAPQRPSGLDGNDVLAMADRAVGAVSGGQGGVQVKRSANGERIRFSLGRSFSISASRGR